jgi:hypothetical protein
MPRPLYPRERAPGTHWIGGWVGPRADLDAYDSLFGLEGPCFMELVSLECVSVHPRVCNN